MVKNEELTYNSNAGFSAIRPATFRFITNDWMPSQLFFVLFIVALVIVINDLMTTQQTLTITVVRKTLTSQTMSESLSGDRYSCTSNININKKYSINPKLNCNKHSSVNCER